MYGISSGALRAALFAQRHPEMVKRLALDAHVWTGEGSPTLAERSKRLPEFRDQEPPADRPQAFVHSIFKRDHPGTADDKVIEAFADAILEARRFDPERHLCRHVRRTCRWSIPTKITVPTIIMRGEYDGIASFDGPDRSSSRSCRTRTSSSR